MKKGWSKTHVPVLGMLLSVVSKYRLESTNHLIEPGVHSTAYTWKSSANVPCARLYGPPMPLAPEYPGPCIVPCTMLGSRPMFSMMSISPLRGQPTASMLSPSIQKAGQRPWPCGMRIRASKRPYVWEKSPLVLIRADVYAHVPYQH